MPLLRPGGGSPRLLQLAASTTTFDPTAAAPDGSGTLLLRIGSLFPSLGPRIHERAGVSRGSYRPLPRLRRHPPGAVSTPSPISATAAVATPTGPGSGNCCSAG